MFKKIILIIGIILLLISTTIAATVEPLSNFHVIAPISESMVAGEESCAVFDFTANYDTTIVINFTIEHPEICSDEWHTTMFLNGVPFSDEISPGVFSTGEIEIIKGYYLLGICYQSHSAVLPDNYNFSLEILSEDIVIKSSSRGRGTSPYTATPLGTLAPTPTPTPIPTILVQEVTSGDNVTIVIVATEEPTDLWSYWPLLVLLFLILLFLYLRKKLEKVDEDEVDEKKEEDD